MKVGQAITDLGHEVVLFLPGPMPAMSAAELKEHYGLRAAVPIQRVPSRPFARRYDFAAGAVWAARAWRPDLVYAWPLPAATLSAWMRLPTLLEMHDRPQGKLGRAWFSWFVSASAARRVIAITDALLRRLRSDFPNWRTSPSADVLPMGVDLERYSNLPNPADARARLGLPPKITAAYTGHFYPGRGIERLFDLARTHPEIQFLWIGGEPESVEPWRRTQQKEGPPNLAVVGFVSQEKLPLYQAASDILLMPYQKRIAGSSGGDTAAFASPMKLFEYLAAGRAIISSDLPVLREVLHEGIARLVPPEDGGAWSRALRDLAEDPSARERLGQAARREAARHSWSERSERALTGIP
jgi:glycosyltransferase involved in cell wall biosynthesis